MVRSTVSRGRKWLGAALAALLVVFVANHSAQARSAHEPKSFSKKHTAKTTYRKKYAKRYSRKRHARRHVRKSRHYARRTHRHVHKTRHYTRRHVRKSRRVAVRRGRPGNKHALMKTLARVKPRGLPLSLAAAVVTVESGWRVHARGSSGEIGLMQLMPATARRFGGGNLHNPTTNMRVGTRYLHYCYKRARGNVAATIGCYNRGPALMWSWSKNHITRRYVSKVHGYMGHRRRRG